MINVLIVDDSAVVRRTLTEILSSDPDIEVIGTSSNPYLAAEKMRIKAPDVIILDLDLPLMNGMTFLEKIMRQHPIPVIICANKEEADPDIIMKALARGAVKYIEKTGAGPRSFLEKNRDIIIETVKSASHSGVRRRQVQPNRIPPKLTADAVLVKTLRDTAPPATDKVVVIGASTGGTEALREVFEALPADGPAIVVVQHMPRHFTTAFANRLNNLCRISIKEAAHKDTVRRGQILVAPGDRHILLKRTGLRYYVELKNGPLVSRHRPSVDVLFRSAAQSAGNNAIGVIMTGMGDDGSRGMLEMKGAGAFNIAQDEKSAIVFGMPLEAIKLGAVDLILPLNKIADEVVKKSPVPLAIAEESSP